jgi:2-keto-4-pentenoate hydratase/2-oxohepta-3-ene-1,7-dioic acid hydratase in catechol pathway
MKLVTYRALTGELDVAEERDGSIYALGYQMPMRELAAHGELPQRVDTHKIMKHDGVTVPLLPRKILCVGRNYAEHAAEMKNEVPSKPLIFSKFTTCVIGSGDTIRWSDNVTQQVDWEGELAVVIGKTARDIREEDAYSHIFGYTIANDVSARDLQSSESQWTRAKGLDTFCPLGPVIVTRDEIPDPHNLRITTEVNGETMQDGHTGDMIFKIPYLVAYLSRTFTLEPGDLILTGTPAGVGKGMTPPRFLGDGDQVRVTIEGIGTLQNTCKID